jgi:hypothetical protein
VEWEWLPKPSSFPRFADEQYLRGSSQKAAFPLHFLQLRSKFPIDVQLSFLK